MPIYEVFIDGKPLKIEVIRTGESRFTAKIDDKSFSIELPADKLDLEKEFSIRIDSRAYKIELPKINREKLALVKVEEATFKAVVKNPTKRPAVAVFEPTRVTPMRRTMAPKQDVEGAVTAPMMGKIISVMVKKGDHVKAGQIVCILEAMKMENEITTPKAGTVQEAYIFEGSSVSEGETLFVIN